MAKSNKPGVVEIHGKEYKTVARRIDEFRADKEDWSIATELVDNGPLVVVKAAIGYGDRILATGYAEEDRSVGKINETSAVENAETSAVGRALAFLGYAGTEIASADEVAGAINQQAIIKEQKRFAAHTKAFRDNQESVMAIKAFLLDGLVDAAREAYRELSEEDQHALWRAPTKGGVWETQELKALKEGKI